MKILEDDEQQICREKRAFSKRLDFFPKKEKYFNEVVTEYNRKARLKRSAYAESTRVTNGTIKPYDGKLYQKVSECQILYLQRNKGMILSLNGDQMLDK